MDTESNPTVDQTAIPATLGQLLKAGRDRLGLDMAETSRRLRISERIIGRIEADDLESLADPVFLRGYLISYARLTGISIQAVEDVLQKHQRAVPLVATSTVPKSRYLLDRWSVSATYMILTGLILGPTVWFAITHRGIDRNLINTTSLQAASPMTSEAARRTIDTVGGQTSEPLASSQTTDIDSAAGITDAGPPPAPVTASLAPFPAPSSQNHAAANAGTAHAMTLTVTEASWVEVVKADGTRLEYGLLAAGTDRSYHSDVPVGVRIGNVAGTRLTVNGSAVDLESYRRGNVANLRLFGENTTVARAEP